MYTLTCDMLTKLFQQKSTCFMPCAKKLKFSSFHIGHKQTMSVLCETSRAHIEHVIYMQKKKLYVPDVYVVGI
jgi:hypothetical protein